MGQGIVISFVPFFKTADTCTAFEIADHGMTKPMEIFDGLVSSHLIIDGNGITGKSGKIIIQGYHGHLDVIESFHIIIQHLC